jgi:hypothetical protein
MPQPAVRFYQDADQHGVLELLQRVFGHWPRLDTRASTAEHLEWKLRPPGAVGHIIAELDGSIVGCVLVIPQRLKFAGRLLDAYQGVDVAVDPRYQATGIMREMLVMLVNSLGAKFDLEYGAPSKHRTMRRASTAAGTRRTLLALNVLSCDTPNARPTAAGDPCSLAAVPAFDERTTAFCEDALAPFAFAAVRTKETLNWRYADSRAGDFSIRLAEDTGTILGYSVLRVSRDTGYEDVVSTLLSTGLHELRQQGATLVQYWLPAAHPYTNIARQCGFAVTERQIDLSFGGLRMGNEELAWLGQTGVVAHVSSGDTDLV